jgi:iron uptake system EfeUOB component EfeO/EfeM
VKKTKAARERLIQSLKSVSPETRKAFKDALEETRKHFEKPEVIQELTSNMSKIKTAFESGQVKEIMEQFKEKHGLSGNTKLTDEMKRKLAEELANGIIGKK